MPHWIVTESGSGCVGPIMASISHAVIRAKSCCITFLVIAPINFLKRAEHERTRMREGSVVQERTLIEYRREIFAVSEP